MSNLSKVAKLSSEDEVAIEKLLQERDAEKDPSPVYIQVLTAIGGWIAASFLLGSLGALTGSTLGYTLPGLIGVALGLFIRRKKDGPFVRQMGGGMIVSGQLGFAIGLVAYVDGAGEGIFALASAMVSCITVSVERRGLVGPSTLAVALAAFAAFLFQSKALVLYGEMIFAALTIGLSFLALLVSHKKMRVEYCALCSLIALVIYGQLSPLHPMSIQAMVIFGAEPPELNLVQIWVGRAVIWLAVMALLYWSRNHLLRYELLGAGLLITLFVAFLSFMLGASFFLLIAGYSLGWRIMSLCGLVSVVWSLSRYYYDMTLTLLDKSIVLFVVGLGLLAAAYFLNKTVKEEAVS